MVLGLDATILRSAHAGPVGRARLLLPVLHRAKVHANQFGKLALADVCGFADDAYIRHGKFKRNGAAHGFARDMALHFFHAFDQLVKQVFLATGLQSGLDQMKATKCISNP